MLSQSGLLSGAAHPGAGAAGTSADSRAGQQHRAQRMGAGVSTGTGPSREPSEPPHSLALKPALWGHRAATSPSGVSRALGEARRGANVSAFTSGTIC